MDNFPICNFRSFPDFTVIYSTGRFRWLFFLYLLSNSTHCSSVLFSFGISCTRPILLTSWKSIAAQNILADLLEITRIGRNLVFLTSHKSLAGYLLPKTRTSYHKKEKQVPPHSGIRYIVMRGEKGRVGKK